MGAQNLLLAQGSIQPCYAPATTNVFCKIFGGLCPVTPLVVCLFGGIAAPIGGGVLFHGQSFLLGCI